MAWGVPDWLLLVLLVLSAGQQGWQWSALLQSLAAFNGVLPCLPAVLRGVVAVRVLGVWQQTAEHRTGGLAL